MTLGMAWSIASQREILGGKRLIDYLDADDFSAADLIVDHSLSHKKFYLRRLQRMSWNKLVEQESYSSPMVTCCGHSSRE